MKEQKQIKALECLNSGKYKDVDGNLYYYHKALNTRQQLKGNVLKSGYTQYILFNSKRGKDSVKVIIYKHIAIYIYHNGIYPEGMQIDHVDRNNQNDKISNLRAVTPLTNILNSKSGHGVGVELRLIRSEEIKDIKRLLLDGLSQSEIALKLDLNRLSVRYIIKQIESGKALKYE